MVRNAHFDQDSFILSAIELVSLGGPASATMSAIAKNAGAPTGSLYHRFPSRTALLGAAWITALGSMSDHMLPLLNQKRTDQAVQALIHWIEENPAFARLIMLYEESDIIDGPLPDALHAKLSKTHMALGKAFSNLLKSLGKDLSPANMALVNFALFDGPIAAMKPALRGQQKISAQCAEAALACCRTTLALLE